MPKSVNLLAHACIDCRRALKELIEAGRTEEAWRPRKPWSGLREGDPIRCGEHGRAWRDRTRRQSWASRIRRFGIEPDLYWAVYEAQGGTCAIPRCPANGKSKMLAADHDHELAARECDHDPKNQACPRCLRGLLCGPHNHELIGKHRNSLQDGLDYLAAPPAPRVVGLLTNVVR